MTLEMTAQARTVLGKSVRHLRRDGITPLNLFGPGREPQALQVDHKLLMAVYRKAGRNQMVTLKIDGASGSVPVMFSEVDYDPIKQQVLHVSMHAVNMTHLLQVEVPVILIGDSPAANSTSRMLLNQMQSLTVQCLPTDIPVNFEIDVTRLEEEDDQIQVKDVSIPAGVVVLNSLEDVIVRVVLSRAGARAAAKGEDGEDVDGGTEAVAQTV